MPSAASPSEARRCASGCWPSACDCSAFSRPRRREARAAPRRRPTRAPMRLVVLVEVQAEGVTGRVEHHPHVVLGLELGELGADRHRMGDRLLEVVDLDVEVHRHLRARRDRPARPDARSAPRAGRRGCSPPSSDGATAQSFRSLSPKSCHPSSLW